MSRGLNRIELIGNVGRDPEMRYTPGGAPVTQFRLAVNSFRRNQQLGQPVTETDWFTIICWNRLAEFADQYIRKGTKVYVSGRLRIRRFTGNNGVERTAVEVVAREILLLTPRSTEVPASEVIPAPEEEVDLEGISLDLPLDPEDPFGHDVPF